MNNDASVVQYIKKEVVPKRKKLSVSSRENAVHESLAKNHCLKVGCAKDYLKKCVQKISDERKNLRANFGKCDEDRTSFILHHVSSRPVKQRTALQRDLSYQLILITTYLILKREHLKMYGKYVYNNSRFY